MAKYLKRAVLSAFAAAIALPMLAAAGCSSASPQAVSATTPPARPGPGRAATARGSDLGHVYSVGETVTVGPYTVCLTHVRLLKDPKPGPELAAPPKVPKGMLLVDLKVTVGNPASGAGAEAVHMPALQDFRLEGENVSLNASETGVGFSPPPAPPSRNDTDSRESTGGSLSRDIQPGDSMAIYPQFVVSPDSESLTLFYAPLEELPAMVVKFKVK
jgi:hypothetical protein